MVGEEGTSGRNSKVARYAACQEFRNCGREGGGIKTIRLKEVTRDNTTERIDEGKNQDLVRLGIRDTMVGTDTIYKGKK